VGSELLIAMMTFCHAQLSASSFQDVDCDNSLTATGHTLGADRELCSLESNFTRMFSLNIQPKFTDIVHDLKPGPVSLIELVGQLDADVAEAFDDRLKALVASGARKIVFDLTCLKYIGSFGLRALVGLAKSLKGSGCVCVFGMNQDVKEVFDVTRVNAVLRVYSSRDDAVDAARSI
jgi:stage II sporulation protein AA (anti-sigma F factor antagonist)